MKSKFISRPWLEFKWKSTKFQDFEIQITVMRMTMCIVVVCSLWHCTASSQFNGSCLSPFPRTTKQHLFNLVSYQRLNGIFAVEFALVHSFAHSLNRAISTFLVTSKYPLQFTLINLLMHKRSLKDNEMERRRNVHSRDITLSGCALALNPFYIEESVLFSTIITKNTHQQNESL